MMPASVASDNQCGWGIAMKFATDAAKTKPPMTVPKVLGFEVPMKQATRVDRQCRQVRAYRIRIGEVEARRRRIDYVTGLVDEIDRHECRNNTDNECHDITKHQRFLFSSALLILAARGRASAATRAVSIVRNSFSRISNLPSTTTEATSCSSVTKTR